MIWIQSRSMSNPTLSDIDFKNKMAWAWTTLKRWKSCLTRPVHVVFIIFLLNNSTCMPRPVALLSFRSTENPVHIIWCSRCYPFHLRWSRLWVNIGHSNECWPWSIFTCGNIIINLLRMPCSKGPLLTLTLNFDKVTALLLTIALLSVLNRFHRVYRP